MSDGQHLFMFWAFTTIKSPELTTPGYPNSVRVELQGKKSACVSVGLFSAKAKQMSNAWAAELVPQRPPPWELVVPAVV